MQIGPQEMPGPVAPFACRARSIESELLGERVGRVQLPGDRQERAREGQRLRGVEAAGDLADGRDHLRLAPPRGGS